MNVTLNQIEAYKPYLNWWRELLRSLGKSVPDDEPIELVYILDTCGIDVAIWCLRCVVYKNYCTFLADVAESVLSISNQKHSKLLVRIIHKIREHAKGRLSPLRLDSARRGLSSASRLDCHKYKLTTKKPYYRDGELSKSLVQCITASAKPHSTATISVYMCVNSYIDIIEVSSTQESVAKARKWKEIEVLFRQHFGD